MVDRKYATVRHPSINALVEGLYLYRNEQDALDRLNVLRNQFVMSRDTAACSDHELIMWIKGFKVDDSQHGKGYYGNYAHISVSRTSEGLFTLSAEKIDRPLSQHPQKRRLESDHPNWGHPFLRRIKRDKADNLYETLEDAQRKLSEFALEFPKVTIPNPGRLYCIVFAKTDEAGNLIKNRTQRIVIDAVQRPDGKYKLVYWHNEKPVARQADDAAREEEDATRLQQDDNWRQSLKSKLGDLLGGEADGEV
ncbi:MAG TPA: hypothetical protein VFQ67_16065 [Allosphingosinicella sp.]|jgi:hypothetical protein|nr:hypothetical protein [Allosphingosinicella sp.]